MKSFFTPLLASFFILLSFPLLEGNDGKNCEVCYPDSNPSCPSSWGITAEARVAYYHPSSKRVRRIYGDGWADYQFEFSKAFQGFGGLGERCGCSNLENLEWRIWTGVSGFSRNGNSIGFHDKTRLQLIPINFGLKIFYPIFCNTKVFIGGAACYSFLRIHDDSRYVHQHIRKEGWGGLFQSGMTYDFCNWAYVSVFFDYYFQRFHFHDHWVSSFSDGSNGSHSDSRRFVERFDLNMNGYKVGVGLGISF